MAHLYHSSCYWSRWRRLIRWFRGEKGMPRFTYRPNPIPDSDQLARAQTFVCNSCGDTIHVDTDWADPDGGFIGESVTIHRYPLSHKLHHKKVR